MPRTLDNEHVLSLAKKRQQLETEIQRALEKGRNSYPNDLLPGDTVVRRDIKGRSKFVVSHTGSSGGYVQVYARKVGDHRGQIVSFDRSQLKMA